MINKPFVLEGLEVTLIESDRILNHNINRYLVNFGIRLLKKDSKQFYDFYRRLYLNNRRDIIQQIYSDQRINLEDFDKLDIAMQRMISYKNNLNKIRKLNFLREIYRTLPI